MGSKHTPGPWIDGDTIDREHIRALRAHGIDRCDCDGCKRMLHAAAPDLLAALRLCVSAMEAHNADRKSGGCHWDFGDSWDGGTIEFTRAAIAKATGGEK